MLLKSAASCACGSLLFVVSSVWAHQGAAVTIDPQELWTEVPAAGHTAVLTVGCDNGYYSQQEFGAGETPSFSPSAAVGGLLPDGECKYQLDVVPDTVAAAKAQGDGLNSPASTQADTEPMEGDSGEFEVIGGQLSAPQAEAEDEVTQSHDHDHSH